MRIKKQLQSDFLYQDKLKVYSLSLSFFYFFSIIILADSTPKWALQVLAKKSLWDLRTKCLKNCDSATNKNGLIPLIINVLLTIFLKEQFKKKLREHPYFNLNKNDFVLV